MSAKKVPDFAAIHAKEEARRNQAISKLKKQPTKIAAFEFGKAATAAGPAASKPDTAPHAPADADFAPDQCALDSLMNGGCDDFQVPSFIVLSVGCYYYCCCCCCGVFCRSVHKFQFGSKLANPQASINHVYAVYPDDVYCLGRRAIRADCARCE